MKRTRIIVIIGQVQDYRDAKLRDLNKTTKALNVKVNSLREANEQKVKELAAAQLKADQLLRKQERRSEEQHKRQNHNNNNNGKTPENK